MASTIPKATIVFWGVCGFLSGTLAASEIGFFYVGLVAAGGYLVSARLNVSRMLSAAALIGVVVGFWYYHIWTAVQSFSYKDFPAMISTNGLIINDPFRTDTYQKFILKPQRGAPFTVISRPTPTVSYAKEVFVSGIQQRNENPGEPPVVLSRTLRIVGEENSGIRGWLFRIKHHLSYTLTSLLPQESGALAVGLLAGDTSGFSPSFKTAMKESGTTHLVALSGYNVAILLFAIETILRPIVMGLTGFFISTGVIAAFVLMTGAQASLVRAAVMGTLVLVAKHSGRIYNGRNAIAATAAAMTILKPTLVRFDIGFQLSFISLLGIIYLKPYLDRLLRPDVEKSSILWDVTTTTISAQLAVLPLLLAYFGTVSFVSVPANIAIGPIVPAAMATAFTAAVFGSFSSALGYAAALPAQVTLGFIVIVIRLFSGFEETGVSGWLLLLSVAGFFGYRLHKRFWAKPLQTP